VRTRSLLARIGGGVRKFTIHSEILRRLRAERKGSFVAIFVQTRDWLDWTYREYEADGNSGEGRIEPFYPELLDKDPCDLADALKETDRIHQGSDQNKRHKLFF
jgi:hypothetical protein